MLYNVRKTITCVIVNLKLLLNGWINFRETKNLRFSGIGVLIHPVYTVRVEMRKNINLVALNN
jgi:hypothetical protein